MKSGEPVSPLPYSSEYPCRNTPVPLAGILQYSLRNTPVLPKGYSSTPQGILQYSLRNTPAIGGVVGNRAGGKRRRCGMFPAARAWRSMAVSDGLHAGNASERTPLNASAPAAKSGCSRGRKWWKASGKLSVRQGDYLRRPSAFTRLR